MEADNQPLNDEQVKDKYKPIYFEVRFFEPAKSSPSFPPTLNGRYSHPDRWVHQVAVHWLIDQDERYPSSLMLRPVDGQAAFPFLNDICEDWLGEYRAEIVQGVDEADSSKSDCFYPANDT